MAISQRAAGAWAFTNATTQVVTIPAGATAGDLMVLVAMLKPYNGTTPTINNGWSLLASDAAGTTANGNGTGSLRCAIFYKVHTGTESDPTVTWGTTSAPGGAVIIALQKAANEAWEISTLATAVEVAMGTTALTANLTTNTAIKNGDWVFALVGAGDDSATFTRSTTAIASAGVTWNGNHVEYPAAHGSSTLSNDIAIDLGYRAVTTGAASGQSVTVTATLSAAERAQVCLFRVGVATASTVSGSFTADAFIKQVTASTFTADAHISKVGIASSFSADAFIKRLDLAGSFTADAYVKQVVTGSLTADAFIKATLSSSFTANAHIKGTVAGSFTADAYIKRTYVYGAGGGGDTTVLSDTFDTAGNPLVTATTPAVGSWAQLPLALYGFANVGNFRETGGQAYVSADGGYSAEDGDGFGYAADRIRAGSTVTDGTVDLYMTGGFLQFRISTSASTQSYYLIDAFGNLYRVTNGSLISIAAFGGSGNWYRVQWSGSSPTSLKVERRTTQGALGTGWLVNTTDNTASNQRASGYVAIEGMEQWDYWSSNVAASTRHDSITVTQNGGGGGGTDGPGITADAYISVLRTGSLTADAYIRRVGIAGAFTADAYVKRVGLTGSVTADAFVKRVDQPGSFAADAFVKRTFSSTFTADAWVKSTIAGTLTANAFVRAAQAASFTASAFIKSTLSGSFSADAFIRQTYSAAFSADAYIRRTQSGTFTLDAEISAPQAGVVTGSFTANAHIAATVAGSLTTDAFIKTTQAGSFTANAYVKRTFEQTLTADAFIKRVGLAGSITADAFVRRTFSGSLTADAFVRVTQAGSFTADAAISPPQAGERTGNFTADAYIKRVGLSGSVTADAFIQRTFTGAITADAYVRVAQAGQFSADAFIARTQSGSFSLDAFLMRVGTGSLTADAFIRASVVGTLTLDAIIFNPNATRLVKGIGSVSGFGGRNTVSSFRYSSARAVVSHTSATSGISGTTSVSGED